MKKYFIKGLSLLLAILLVPCLFACKKEQEEDPSPEPEKNPMISVDEQGVRYRSFENGNCEVLGFEVKTTSETITALNIPATSPQGTEVTSIGASAFRDCPNLTAVTLPNTLTTIGNEAFSGCTALTSFTVPESVISLGEKIFQGCTALQSVSFAGTSKCTAIGNSAFYGCTSLTTLTLPKSLTSIGYFAFYDCTALTDVNYEGTKAEWASVLATVLTANFTLHCTDGKIVLTSD